MLLSGGRADDEDNDDDENEFVVASALSVTKGILFMSAWLLFPLMLLEDGTRLEPDDEEDEENDDTWGFWFTRPVEVLEGAVVVLEDNKEAELGNEEDADAPDVAVALLLLLAGYVLVV